MRRFAVLLATMPFAAVIAPPVPRPAAQAYVFQHDGILGTSLDLTFVTISARDAQAAERIALDEIERLRRVISTWDSTSEVSRLVTTGHLVAASPDLIAVLNRYTEWQARTGNAYSARVGRLVTLWRDGQRDGRIPDASAIAAAVQQVQRPAWHIDGTTVTMTTAAPIDLNSLGKGYVIDRVVSAVRTRLPALRGGLINIGGDVRGWGEAPSAAAGAWRVAIADPKAHADNAAPLTELRVTDRAVSSSGNYERGFDIAGRHWSHIIDPRSGYPVDHHIGVTVIANDNATANALATTLSVLSSSEGMHLVATIPGAEALIVTATGAVLRSPGFARYEAVSAVRASAAPAGIQATITIDITPTVPNRHRPYVAVWVTDTTNRHVRTLAFWGSKPKYQKEMSRWWGSFSDDAALVDAVTRATRATGKYTLEWDGLDQAGAAVAPGAYRFWLEGAFEDGPHSVKSVIVRCGSAKASGVLDPGAAFAGGQVECGPAGGK